MTGNIAKVEFIPVNVPASNWSQNTVICKVTDENGVYGLGEADGSPDVLKQYSELETEHTWLTNLKEVIIGKDPLEMVSLWDRMYDASRWVGMRGLGIFAISGIDMALYDLAGKQLGVPAYKLLGGSDKQSVSPYLTLYPDVAVDAPVSEAVEKHLPLLEKARKKGIKALKVCVQPGSPFTNNDVVTYIREIRNALGFETDLMVDFLYRWNDWFEAAQVLNKLEGTELFFAEAVLQHDDLVGHKKLAENTNARICGAEMSTTRFEARQWLDQAGAHVIQPDYNRCGGLTELRRIVDMANMENVLVMPHNWKTGITALAAIHYQFALGNAPYFEFVHPDFYNGELRTSLLDYEAPMENGSYLRPEKPGFGADVNVVFLEKLGVKWG